MAIPLAIGYLALPPRKPVATSTMKTCRAWTVRDDMPGRPPIPCGVVTWPDDVLAPNEVGSRGRSAGTAPAARWRALRRRAMPHVDEA